ncbi:MAG TPA: EAL domain-containing protein [Novosphingobium sp.]|nr:EAL domain-containing protein [Novosphingobium sp.]
MSGAIERRDQGERRASARAVVGTRKASVQNPRASGQTKPLQRLIERFARLPEHGGSLVGSEWMFVAPSMAMALLIAAVSTWSLPGPFAGVLCAAGILISLLSRAALPFELRHARTPHRRYWWMAALVGLPTILFSVGLCDWLDEVSLGVWMVRMCGLIIVGTMAAATLQGRLPASLTAIAGLWIGSGIESAPVYAAAVLLLSCGLGLYMTRLCCRRSEQKARIEEEERRVQFRAEQLLSEYERTGQGWFWETDRRGLITYVSPRIAQLLGASQEDTLGRLFTDMFRLDTVEKDSERTLNFHLSTRSSFQDLAVLAATNEREERWWSITGRPIMDQFNNFLGFRGSGTDLTETKRSQRHVTELARFDSLTKLANRFQMSEWLEKILTAPRAERRACAIFLLDLDRFKQVNDTMGHPAGDALLGQVADRLRSTVGKRGSVGRLGGDEFKIILPGHQSHANLANLAKLIIENLSQPYSIEGHRVIIGASVGIAMCPDNGTTSEELIRNADLALYAAKDGGRGRHHFYAQDLHSEAEERRQLEQDLRDAISQGALELHYQPQVRTTTEKIAGFEALLRWNHPKHGYLSPAKFVPIAEDTGLIAQIGEWALRTACTDLARWPKTVRVAVNVSPLQFANPALPAIVTSAIASAGIAPSRLELEITESVFLNDDKSTEAMFSALKSIGVRLALDDFGTGYSSLGYLKSAPFDKIKIDQSFVRGATISGSRNGAIISSIVSLAEALGMETTAEGVETLDELDLIRMLGCSHIQGYIYEKALTAQAATARLESGLTAIAKGPQSARAPRQTMLRKVMLEHGQHRYQGTIRNISTSGAMIEGLWNVPAGTRFGVHLSKGFMVTATARWSKEDRMGVEFAAPLDMDDNGAVSVVPPGMKRAPVEQALLRKVG